MINLKAAAFAVSLAIAASGTASAAVVSFEDLGPYTNFGQTGLYQGYAGYNWGVGQSGGVANRQFGTQNPGWSTGTTPSPIISPAPSGVDGSSYAWTWGGPQSLWIDFLAPTAFVSGDFAILSTGYGSGNSNSLQLFGYDEADNLVATSSLLSLTGSFQTLTANFGSVRYLEIRSDRTSSWFSVDRLVTADAVAEVPEPAMLGLLGLGTLGLALRRRRRAA
ncbi:MAG: PEP-CTERM sorting domain-containing protein [Sphingomonadaceae bacterium]|nr:PEP-CTERM sorting domain-containing protein [Sphingomonadaceae bacterium]